MRDFKEELIDLEEKLLIINNDNCDLSKLVKLFDYEEWNVFVKTINDNLNNAINELTYLDMNNFMVNDEKKAYVNNLLIRIDVIRKFLNIPISAENKLKANNSIIDNLKAKILALRKKINI